jgi:hypothetical protein
MTYLTRSKKKYSKNLFGILFIGAGAFLIIEHIWAWGEFSFFDFFGHEWLGLILILLGIGINLNFKTPLSEELKKIREWFK